MLVTRVQLEVEDEREQNSVLCSTVTTLEDENKELAGDNARLEKHLQKLTDSIAKKDDQMTIFQQEVSRLKEVETSQHSQLQRLEHTLANLQGVETKLRSEYTQSILEVHRMKSQMAEMKTEQARLEHDLNQATKSSNAYEQANQKLKQTTTTLEAKLTSVSQQLQMTKEREENVVRLVQESQQETADVLEQMHTKVASGCDKVRTEMTSLHQMELGKCKAELELSTQENIRLSTRINTINSDYQDLEKRARDTSNQLQMARNDIQAKVSQNEKLSKKLDECSNAKDALEAKVSSLTGELRDMKGTREQEGRSIKSLQRQLQEAKSTIAAERSHHANVLKVLENDVIALVKDKFEVSCCCVDKR